MCFLRPHPQRAMINSGGLKGEWPGQREGHCEGGDQCLIGEKRCLEGVRPLVTTGKDLGAASKGGIQAGMWTFQESKLQSNPDLDVYLERGPLVLGLLV